jgi:hypothetical protein
MTDGDAIRILEEKLNYIATLRYLSCDSKEFKQWRRDTKVAIKKIFASDGESHAKEFDDIFSPGPFCSSDVAYPQHLRDAEAKLNSMVKEIKEYGLTTNHASDGDVLSSLLTLFKRFDRVVRQLSKRHAGRTALQIKDEYDVQDFLHVLLKLYFDDIRPEGWVPSYAGSSSRMDFLLKNEQTVIETKKTRKGLADKKIGEQLIIDIRKYRSYPDCKSLICFVYDPEGKIANPKALENDLSKSEQDFKVTVIVEPK